MKSYVVVMLLLSSLILSNCNYFKRHRLFSKGEDTVQDMTVEEPKPVVEDTSDLNMEEIKQPTIEETPYIDQNDKYFMIVGSFMNYNLAKLYAEKIQQMGYQTQIIEASNGFFRVSAKSYNNFNQGISEIDDFRASITPGAWLHVKR
jgi:hypothetical protein